MTNFLKQLDIALQDPLAQTIKTSIRHYEQEKAKTLIENIQPQAGIYYWIPINQNQWKLYAFWEEFYGTKAIHAIIWHEYLAQEVAELYNLKDKTKEIAQYPYGLPRGRIFKTKDGKITLWHGGDQPPDWLEQAMKEFNLTKENLEIIQHQHEKPNQIHQEKLKQLGIPITPTQTDTSPHQTPS